MKVITQSQDLAVLPVRLYLDDLRKIDHILRKHFAILTYTVGRNVYDSLDEMIATHQTILPDCRIEACQSDRDSYLTGTSCSLYLGPQAGFIHIPDDSNTICYTASDQLSRYLRSKSSLFFRSVTLYVLGSLCILGMLLVAGFAQQPGTVIYALAGFGLTVLMASLAVYWVYRYSSHQSLIDLTSRPHSSDRAKQHIWSIGKYVLAVLAGALITATVDRAFRNNDPLPPAAPTITVVQQVSSQPSTQPTSQPSKP